MRKPTIHLNGSSQLSLAAGYEQAYHAIQAAIDAVSETSPNGRDYYPQGQNALTEAVAEHTARLSALGKVKREIEEILESIE